MDLNKAVVFEKDSFAKSKFMQKLHTVRENEEIDSPILTDIRPVSWISYQNSIIPQTSRTDKLDGPDQVVYHPSHEMDYLFYVFLATESPRIAVKAEYRDKVEVCLPYNLFHHMIISGETRFGTANGPVIPDGWLDQQAAFHMKTGPGHEANYNRSIGNLRSLTEWTSVLPSISLRCPQPWWFSESYIQAVPLLYCNKTAMTFRYSYNLHVLNLLRMRMLVEKEDGTRSWIYITDLDEKEGFLDKVSMDTKFSTPIMHGRYGKIDEAEHGWKLGFSQSVLATSVIKKSTSNTVSAGTSATIALDTATPIYAMYFSAQHVRAREIGNLSNYTTNPDDQHQGWDPIRTVNHKYSDMNHYVQDQADFNDMQPWYHATSSPREPGYGMYAKGGYPNKTLPDVGLVYDKDLAGSVEFQMIPSNSRSTNVNNEDDSGEDVYQRTLKRHRNGGKRDSRDQYYISLYLLTRLVLKFEYDKPVLIDDGTKRLEDDYAPIAASSRI